MSTLIQRMQVRHSTGTLPADVTYSVADVDGKPEIEVISIKSPYTGWELTQMNGVSAQEMLVLKMQLKGLEESKAA